MNRAVKSWSAALAVAFALSVARAADPDPKAIPIPEQRVSYGWSESQRILYKNQPLMRKAIAAIKAGDNAAAESALEQILEFYNGFELLTTVNNKNNCLHLLALNRHLSLVFLSPDL